MILIAQNIIGTGRQLGLTFSRKLSADAKIGIFNDPARNFRLIIYNKTTL